MAKRYFNVFRNHVLVLLTLVGLIILSEVTSGMTATIANICAGLVMIYIAINYALWLLKAPTMRANEENL